MLQIQARGLLFASKEVGLEVNFETIKCMFMYHEEWRTKSEHKDGYYVCDESKFSGITFSD